MGETFVDLFLVVSVSAEKRVWSESRDENDLLKRYQVPPVECMREEEDLNSEVWGC